MVLNNLQIKPTEVPGFQPRQFEAPEKLIKPPELKKNTGVFGGENGEMPVQSGSVLEEGQIRLAIEHAVKEVGQKEENGEVRLLSQEDLGHVIENVELNLGKKLDGMSPHQLLETIINLPRNNN